MSHLNQKNQRSGEPHFVSRLHNIKNLQKTEQNMSIYQTIYCNQFGCQWQECQNADDWWFPLTWKILQLGVFFVASSKTCIHCHSIEDGFCVPKKLLSYSFPEEGSCKAGQVALTHTQVLTSLREWLLQPLFCSRYKSTQWPTVRCRRSC